MITPEMIDGFMSVNMNTVETEKLTYISTLERLRKTNKSD